VVPLSKPYSNFKVTYPALTSWHGLFTPTKQ